MKRILQLLTLVSLVAIGNVSGQQLPVYSQYFMNPYLYNPSFVGSNDYTELNITHRQQWVGIEDAPVTNAINLQVPTAGRLSFGMSAYSDKSVLLRNSSLLLSMGYELPLERGVDHYIKFGMSIGGGMNRFDMDAIGEVNDPALINVINTNYYMDGQFGLHYRYKNLTLGFALPKLFQSKAVSEDPFNQVKFEQFQEKIFTASYKFEVVPNVLTVEPHMIYRTGSRSHSKLEGVAVATLKDLVWLGGGYRENYGATAFAGVKVKDFLKVGYAYEFARPQQTSFGNGTHELQINMAFGKKKVRDNELRYKRNRPVVKRAPKPNLKKKNEPKKPKENELLTEEHDIVDNIEEAAEGQEEIVAEEPVSETATEEVEANEVEEVAADPQLAAIDELKSELGEDSVQIRYRIDDVKDLKVGNYIIVGAFKEYKYALDYKGKVSAKMPYSGIGYMSDKQFYYVYAFKSGSLENLKKLYKRVLSYPEFKEAWIMITKNKE
ncbi:PorP/SprF family type IX secretion system membrane protein [Rapidithrix thailandica]|uniref:PorP/SprF family type IX secretion system membrane protein n=1 Tax=Rapidithrix thailandica TaxID=413964 RepID=A0AAW9S820_9BACT